MPSQPHASPVRPSLRVFLAAAALALFAAGCAVNPATGKREFTLVTTGQELAMGQDGYAATVAEYGKYDDAALAAYVDSVGHRLARVSERPELDWHFTVLDDPMVNAFAMPGGYIYVTRGILAHLNSEAQLAGVLGHEIGHVTARHSAKQITQQQIAGLGVALAGAFSTTFQKYSGAAQQALGLLALKYSRDDETQADELGIRYATAAGYDPREIPATYAMLKRVSQKGGSTLPFYLSTHPDPGNREQHTGVLSAQAAAGKSNLLVRNHPYLEHLRGLVFGDDPRAGWFDGAHFTQPQMGFEMEFPAGWKTQNGRASVSATEPQGKGGLQLSLASTAGALSPSDFVAALRRDGHIAGAEGGAESIGGWSAWTGRVVVPGANGASTVLVAAWVRVGPDRMLQFVGQGATAGDPIERAILVAARTVQPLRDAKRTNPEPDRVRLKIASNAGSFQSLLARFGTGALSPEDVSIVNGVAVDEPIAPGRWLKFVEAGHRR
jgi:predicted Zn-dependent protease